MKSYQDIEPGNIAFESTSNGAFVLLGAMLTLMTSRLSTITGVIKMDNERLARVPPGEVLVEELLIPMNISQNRLALDIRVPARRINEIVLGKRRITPDTALRLARYFGMSAQFWLGLQLDYDLDVAKDELGDRIEREVQVYSPA